MTDEQKRENARKGGRALVAKYGREHMRRIGSNGGRAFHEKYVLVPVGIGDMAIVHRVTHEVLPKTINGLNVEEYGK